MRGQPADPALRELIAQSHLDYAPREKIAILERAISMADALNELEAAFDLRLELCNVATMGGYQERTIPALAWCVAQTEADPLRFPVDQVLWQYKWVSVNLPRWPAASPKLIAMCLDDLEARYIANGWGRRGPLKMRQEVALMMGDVERSQSYQAQWLAIPRDRGSDCRACELSTCVEAALVAGNDAAALSHARPLLDGKQTCASEPHQTFARLLPALRRTGRAEQADDVHARGRRLVGTGRQYHEARAFHSVHDAIRARFDAAAADLSNALSQLKGSDDAFKLLDFYIPALPAFRLLADAGVSVPHAGLATQPEEPEPDGHELVTQIGDRSRRYASLFDKRNGNTHYSSRVEHALSAPLNAF